MLTSFTMSMALFNADRTSLTARLCSPQQQSMRRVQVRGRTQSKQGPNGNSGHNAHRFSATSSVSFSSTSNASSLYIARTSSLWMCSAEVGHAHGATMRRRERHA
jgi:hypothetical protein